MLHGTCFLSETPGMNSELIKGARIFVVDDEPATVRQLKRLLTDAGYTNLWVTLDSQEALQMFADDNPDLVLLGLRLPDHDGYDILAKMRGLVPVNDFLPIIVLTANITAEARWKALAAGATDFLSKPLDQMEVVLRIENVLRTRFLHRQLQNQTRLLEERTRERSELLERTIAELRARSSPAVAENL
jgi:putative two-component system response regulator